MEVKKTIRVRKETVNELLKQECVERVEQWHDGNIVVKLLPGYTDGKPELRKGEYLVQFNSGKWQRFGAEAFQKLLKNPGKEAGAAWDE